MCDPGQRLEVGHPDQRVGAHLAEQDPCAIGHRALHRVEVLEIDDAARDPEARQVVAHEGERRAVAVVGGHQVIARVHLAHQGDGDRRHSRADCHRVEPVLESVALEAGHGRLQLSVILRAPAAVAAVFRHRGIERLEVRVAARRSDRDVGRDRRILAIDGGLAGVHRHRVRMRHRVSLPEAFRTGPPVPRRQGVPAPGDRLPSRYGSR